MTELPKPAAPKRERKTRRTHKNSRDGCPNCRSKRIKCTEELPSCGNCLKKGYRCGYLEFPPEKLEIIRKKNEIKHAKTEDSDFMTSTPLQTNLSEGGVGLAKSEGSIVDTWTGQPKKHRASITIRRRKSSPGLSVPNMSSLRSDTYQKTLKVMTEGSKSPSSAAKRNKGNDFMFHWGVNHTRSPKPVSKEELFYGTSEYIEHLFRSPQVDEFSPALTGSNLQTPANIDHAESLGHVDPNHVKNEHDLNGLHLQAPPISSMDILLRSKMLPSSKIVHRTFLKQKLPPHLQNMKLENTLKMVRDGNFHLKAVTNHVPQATISPVWSEQQGQNFWVIVLKQAMVLDLYFKYFIDKSVNILMRASKAVVNGDIDVSVLPATTSGSSSPSDSPSPELKFFYTKEDLHLLTCKSYVTYGRLVRELRESINKYHNEYPAKISLYWAWACYINLDADFNTFCIMIRGTLLLIHNVIMEAQSLAEVSSAIRQEIMLINDFVHATKFPDYLFDVILDLAANFRTYQQLVGGFISRYENGETFNDDLTKVLRDPLFRHECHELDKFITSCQTHYYPKFAGINNYYKERKNLPQDTNAFFVSPKLVFEMAYDWFRIYPGDKMSLNSENDPLKRTLYFFYHALAKSLAHVFSLFKSLLFVDVCNIMFTKVGMPLSDFDPHGRPLYAPFEPLARGLIKTIKFFENRLRLYCYHLENSDILQNEFVNAVDDEPPTNWSHRDIVHLVSPKVAVLEHQLSSVSTQIVSAENYAFFPRILNDEVSSILIRTETERQMYALKNEPYQFDWQLGLLNHDFNPTSVISRFVNTRNHELHTQPSPSLEVIRAQINELIRSRDEIQKASERT